MEIVGFTLGPYATNTYLVKEGDFCCAIDPEKDDGEVAKYLEKRGWRLSDILITHAHLDHVGGINGLPPDAKIWIHQADAPFLPGRNEEIGIPFFKEEPITRPFTAFADGETIGPFTAMHFPGHSPGSSLFICPGHVFSGDSLFIGARPVLDFHNGDAVAYLRSLGKTGAMDRGALLHAGHGICGTLGEALL